WPSRIAGPARLCVSHNRTEPSNPLVTRSFPSALSATSRTPAVWPSTTTRHSRRRVSQNRALPARQPLTHSLPSPLSATPLTSAGGLGNSAAPPRAGVPANRTAPSALVRAGGRLPPGGAAPKTRGARPWGTAGHAPQGVSHIPAEPPGPPLARSVPSPLNATP